MIRGARLLRLILWSALGAALGGGLAPAPALAACQIGKFADLPVTMVSARPIVATKINGRDARFILDSGAFFSTVSKATALEYGLQVRGTGSNARLAGVGGETSLGVTTAKTFTIVGQDIPKIDFAVGGSDTGYAGLLGQNILGLADVEYDLPHGVVRLLKVKDCKTAGLAYWAGDKPFTLVEIEAMGDGQRRTVGTVEINGVKIKALFDTGATSSMLTQGAARRLGVKPDSPGVVSDGFVYGMGEGRVPIWRARFDLIDIGGEAIKRPWIKFADQSLGGADMLIGIDFFLSHRVLVDNQNHRMFVTYEGGPMFGLDPKTAVDQSGAALDLVDKSGEPTDAAGYARRGGVQAAGGKYAAAIADFDKAVALAPGEAQYVLQRGMARLADHQLLLASSDLDKAIELAPGDPAARLTRAQLRLGARDPAGAQADLKAAGDVLSPSADSRLRLAGLYTAADLYEPALVNYDLWLQSHPEDSGRASAFNGRCWTRALLNRDLDQALSDCNAALRMRPNEAKYLDSRALVRLRRGDLDKALADYDAALATQPRNAWSLYARGVVQRRLGKADKADADRALALSLSPQVAERAKRYRLED